MWAARLARRGNELGILTVDNLFRAIDLVIALYYISKEKKLKPFEPKPPVDSVDPKDPNEQRREFFEKQGLPPQCKRRVYVDQNGVLKSVVICESLGNQRVYHDY